MSKQTKFPMGIDSKKVYSFLRSKTIRRVGEEDWQGKSSEDGVELRLCCSNQCFKMDLKMIAELIAISGELFTLTYGALVAELLRDLESPLAVNRQLDKMGYNIGLRLADDLLAKNSQIQRCTDMHQVADVLAKVALRSYLGITAQVSNWSARNDEFSLVLESNPLAEFVEVPPELAQDLRYSQILCGAIRGALEMMHMEVQTFIVQEQCQSVEIRVKFIRILQESVPPGDD